jgi:hypothetical protein
VPLVGKPRRPRGTGSISVRPDRKADAELKVTEWDGTLTRHRKRLPNKQAAERWLVRVRYEQEQGMLLSKENERLTLPDVVARIHRGHGIEAHLPRLLR